MTAKTGAILVGMTLLFALTLALCTARATHGVTANLQWLHYLDAGLPEQDVFIDPVDVHAAPPDPDFLGPHEILTPSIVRVEGKSALMPSTLDSKVYAARIMVPHDPLKVGSNPLGPYYKGDRLGFTLRQWLAARGSGTYTVSGADAALDLAFEQLVPDGHFALWCGRMRTVPNYEEIEKPCGAADGSQNRFKADAQGNATFHLKLKALPASTPTSTTTLTLTYERDVDPSEGGWGGYGLSSHVQLFYAFPLLPLPPAPSTISVCQNSC